MKTSFIIAFIAAVVASASAVAVSDNSHNTPRGFFGATVMDIVAAALGALTLARGRAATEFRVEPG
ncbi:hypothetical protein CONLIGDRAFT_686485 [Coniochaeta ligniaria NRRL 30616]|uniref:Uncharacterized protein n=1 Tax=Coniochaeta ligniaria NRRL 30616 TaxID=1408157 RepID=A0A1J7I7E0_9PEZI|nr:hypothetical protein CONLIGDRAFT_686485 [Coniochaeta ligniaria NRRL 30616]